jgi:hypothetical protein
MSRPVLCLWGASCPSAHQFSILPAHRSPPPLLQANHDLQALKGGLAAQAAQLRGQVDRLQAQLAACEQLHARAMSEHGADLAALRCACHVP